MYLYAGWVVIFFHSTLLLQMALRHLSTYSLNDAPGLVALARIPVDIIVCIHQSSSSLAHIARSSLPSNLEQCFNLLLFFIVFYGFYLRSEFSFPPSSTTVNEFWILMYLFHAPPHSLINAMKVVVNIFYSFFIIIWCWLIVAKRKTSTAIRWFLWRRFANDQAIGSSHFLSTSDFPSPPDRWYPVLQPNVPRFYFIFLFPVALFKNRGPLTVTNGMSFSRLISKKPPRSTRFYGVIEIWVNPPTSHPKLSWLRFAHK